MKNISHFEEFIAEKKSSEAESLHEMKSMPMMSEKAMQMVKEVCEGMLHTEAAKCHENSDPLQTYEKYCNEAESYMKKCLKECSEVYTASAKGMAGK
jgi:3-deoxy-D-manno-octulosonic-acid transferase